MERGGVDFFKVVAIFSGSCEGGFQQVVWWSGIDSIFVFLH